MDVSIFNPEPKTFKVNVDEVAILFDDCCGNQIEILFDEVTDLEFFINRMAQLADEEVNKTAITA